MTNIICNDIILFVTEISGCSLVVELQPSKLIVWVRFPSSAPLKTVTLVTVFFLLFFNSSLYLGISYYKLGFVGMFKYEKCKLCPCINCKLCGCIIHNTTIFCGINNIDFYIILRLTVVGANIVRPLKSVIPMGFLSCLQTINL